MFAYSYAARQIFRTAKAAGCVTVLGQIDPGKWEEDIVAKLDGRTQLVRSVWRPAPTRYWEEWRDELELADHIIVNSQWARDGLLNEGVRPDKLHVFPLCFELSRDDQRIQRSYPDKFTIERPLRVLFLGSPIIRKGIAEVFEAMELLRGDTITLSIVGGSGESPQPILKTNQIRWAGVVPRHLVHAHYRAADVFLLPTHSDGFALTQLEAQAWGLPVIASRSCGEVVQDRSNGLLLREVSGPAIAEALRSCLSNPSMLSDMSARALRRSTSFRPEAVLNRLLLL